MQIRRIRLESLRGLGVEQPLDLVLDSMDGTLAGWHVVVGPNGSGKSTFVRAIALACAGPLVSKALKPSRDWWMAHGRSAARSLVEVIPGRQDRWNQDGTLVPALRPMEPGDTVTLDVSIDKSGTRGGDGDPRPETGPWLDVDRPPGWFVAGYGATRHLGASQGYPGDVDLPDSRPMAQLWSLFRPTGEIPNPVAWLKQLQMQKFDGLGNILALLSDGLLPRGATAVDVAAEGLIVREAAGEFALSELSDGYQSVVGLVLDLVRQLTRADPGLQMSRRGDRWTVVNDGVVLIDEIEAHLHPAWQRRIGGWMTVHFPNFQFIVTTHSPFVCQAATSGCVIRLARIDEGVSSRVMAPSELRSVLAGTADDIYLSQLFGVESTRSAEAEADLDRAACLEARILDGQASEAERAEYRKLKARIPPSADVIQAIRAARRGVG